MLATFYSVFGLLLFILWMLLLARIIIEFIRSLSRDWHPRGITVVILESIMTITDVPVNLLRKIIPQLMIGSIRIDLSIMVLLFGVFSAMEWVLQRAT